MKVMAQVSILSDKLCSSFWLVKQLAFPWRCSSPGKAGRYRDCNGKSVLSRSLQQNTFPAEIIHQLPQQRLRGPHLSGGDMGSICYIFQLCVGVCAHMGWLLSLAGCSSEER